MPPPLLPLAVPPLESSAWKEQVLFQEGIPNNAMPLDIDGDGDLDVLAAKRVRNQLVLIENLGLGEGVGCARERTPFALRRPLTRPRAGAASPMPSRRKPRI